MPRCCILVDQYPTSVWLHGFSDTSQRAYAAVLYLSSSYADNHMKLGCSVPKHEWLLPKDKPYLDWNFWEPDISQASTVCVSIVTSSERHLPVDGLHDSSALDLQ